MRFQEWSVENLTSGSIASDLTDGTSTDIIAAPGANNRLYISEVTVTNSHATQGTVVKLLSGTTLLKRFYAAAVGGGASIVLDSPLRCGANEAFKAQCETVGASVQVSASGYKARI